MSINYESPKDNPKLLKTYIDYLKSNNDDLIDTKSCFEAFFFIAKLCNLELAQNEMNTFLEKTAINVFIRALKCLYDKVESIDFNGKIIKKEDPPKLDKDFKENIFVCILYTINILNKYSKVIFYKF